MKSISRKYGKSWSLLSNNFEQQYGISSEECYRRFMAGEMEDTADIVEWMGLYDNVLLYRERLAMLHAAAEAS